MPYFVYIIKTLDHFKNKTYVGYTNDLDKRLRKHNQNKGAKATRGYKWEVIYIRKDLLINLKLCLMNINLKMIERNEHL